MPDSDGENTPQFIVGVGASAGGLVPCKRLLAQSRGSTGIAFIVVLHLDRSRTSHLAEVLATASGMPVHQVTTTVKMESDHAYVIAPNTSLELIDGEIRPGEPLQRGIGSGVIDLLFSSLAGAYGHDAAAIVMSGIGSDGSAGLADVKAAGGLCIAQDPNTAEHPAMPRSAIGTGLVDAVLAPNAMLAYLLEHVAKPRSPAPDDDEDHDEDDDEDDNTAEFEGFEGILRLLAIHHGFDARNYKKGTLERRARRRLVLLPFSDWGGYLRYIKHHPEELAALYQDVLIGVTQFFRDPEQWEYLSNEIVPALLNRSTDEPIRIWSVGCATGEEAYSLAILVLEQLERRNSGVKLQIFATDVSQKAIEYARRGVYPANIAEHVSPTRLAQFFTKRGDSYQVQPRVRELVTLAQHDLLSEPPFSRLDLISCRNLFIYLEPHAQRTCIERFYFALQPHGTLWLGSSEAIGRQSDLFTTLSGKFRLFRKAEAHRTSVGSWESRAPGPSSFGGPLAVGAAAPERSAGRVARALELYVLEHHVHACVVINTLGNVLHMFGPISQYLSPPTGEVRLDLVSWVREASLYARLRPALSRSIERREQVLVEGIQLRRGPALLRTSVSIEPISTVDEALFLVVFQTEQPPSTAAVVTPNSDGTIADETLVRQLTTQLQDVQVELQAALEELDHANEEYRASYEELVSLNEELQSSNEELETTKEEAQSINEELLMVNRELEERNDKLRTVNADLENLLALTTIPTVFLDRQLRIRRYTPAAERVMWLVATDIGRPIQQIQRRVADDQLLVDAGRVLAELAPIEAEVRADEGRWYLRKIVPFRAGDRIDGVCIIYYDITSQKLATEHSEEARYFAESIVRSSRLPFVVFDHELTAVSANEVFYQTFATSKDQVEGLPLARMCNGSWDRPQVHALLERVLAHNPDGNSIELDQELQHDGRRSVRLTASLLERGDRTPLILLSIEDVTPLREAQEVASRRTRELEREHQRKDEFLAMLGHELRNPLSALVNGLALLEQVEADPEQVDKIHPMLVRQTRRMTVMLDQLLDISRVSSGKIVLEIEVVDLVDVARAAIEGVQPMIAANRHELRLSLPKSGTLLVSGDFVRLVQVVENLLANAARYTEEHGTIWLTVDAINGSARISVRDTGVGIDPELLPRIFEVFTQGAQQLDRKRGGLGLGLALARQLVDMHGGEIEALSAGPGEGSEFVVLLPRARAEQPLTARTPEPADALLDGIPPLRVLIVDDEQDAAQLLADLLRGHGHQVDTAYDGHTAIAIAGKFDPQVVLLDIGLPDLDGYHVATRLRSRVHPGTRLVAVTGYQRDDARLQAAGFDDHVIKPPAAERLAEVLRAAAEPASTEPASADPA